MAALISFGSFETMHLKQLTLAGFKSFAQSVRIPFVSHRVGIVGPNGCGKSNVIDAVRWVIGERSPKQLRGENMSDVIFNGSQSRGPASRAMVELVFDHADGRLTGPFSVYPEIVVRREMNRDGTSHYFLNGSRCRRSDVMALFSGTGLGPRSYAIIEQGMISRIVEASPQELRFYIEEAAGIGRYKDRKHDTESHLEATEANLARLNDILLEQAGHIQHLTQQAELSVRYQQIKEQRDAAQRAVAALKWRALEEKKEKSEQALKQLLGEESLLQQSLQDSQNSELLLQEQIHSLYESLQMIQEQLLQEEQHLNQTSHECADNEKDILRHQSEIEKIDLKKSHQVQSAAMQAELSAGLMLERDRWSQEMQTHEGRVACLNQDKTEQEQQLAQLKLSRTEKENVFRQAQKIDQDQSFQIRKTREWMERAQLRGIELKQVLDGLKFEEAGQLLERHAQSREQAQKELETLELQVASCEQEKNKLQEDWDLLRQQKQQIETELQVLRSENLALEAMQNASLGQAAGRRQQWLTAQKLDSGVLGTLSLEVLPGWERALEVVLGQSLHGVILDDEAWEACWDSAKFQNAELNADLTLLRQWVQPSSPTHDAHRDQVPNTLKDCVLRGGDYWSEDWANIHCAQTLEEAQQKCAQLPVGASVITPQGIWLSRHWIRFFNSSDPQVGFLSRQHRLQALIPLLDAAQEKCAQFEKQMAQMKDRSARVQEALKQAQHALKQGVQTLERQTHEWMKAEGALKALESKQVHVQSELEKYEGQLEKDAQTLAQLEAAQATHHPILQGSEQEWREHCDAAKDLERAVQITSGQYREAFDRLHAAQRECEKISVRLEEIQKQRIQGDQILRQLDEEREVLLEKIQTQNQLQLALVERHQAAQASHTAVKARVGTSQSEWQALQHQQELVSVEQKAWLEQLQTLHRQIEEKKILRERHRVEIEQLCSDFDRSILQNTLDLLEDRPLSEWQKNKTDLEKSFAALGPVNLAAPQELEEALTRRNHLQGQLEDVEHSVKALREAIASIDQEMRLQFLKVFEEINGYFQKLFPEIFGGGSAALSLDGDEVLTAGILMTARPLGKRNQSVQLLSGGEKALTALAFVFAIFQRNPAPFCILDEVDAPLDESNLRRFGELLTKMSQEVQFIFISHHPVTLSVATHLVGITMQEMGVSRLVAVDMEEALATAEN